MITKLFLLVCFVVLSGAAVVHLRLPTAVFNVILGLIPIYYCIKCVLKRFGRSHGHFSNRTTRSGTVDIKAFERKAADDISKEFTKMKSCLESGQNKIREIHSTFLEQVATAYQQHMNTFSKSLMAATVSEHGSGSGKDDIPDSPVHRESSEE